MALPSKMQQQQV